MESRRSKSWAIQDCAKDLPLRQWKSLSLSVDADLELSVPVTKTTALSRGVPQCPLVLLLQLDVLRVYELIINLNSPSCRLQYGRRLLYAALAFLGRQVTGYYVVPCPSHCGPRIIMMMPPRRAATRLGSSSCRISTETTMSNKGGVACRLQG
jgi:hypothetical protein